MKMVRKKAEAAGDFSAAHETELALPPACVQETAGDRVVAALQAAGHTACRVGGCVRDRLLGRPVTDVDVATSATPEQVQALFPSTYAVGAAFGVVIVHLDPDGAAAVDVEVATFRSESGYVDGRHPGQVCFSSPREDASRRDFTINALFYDPAAERLYDFTGGLADLQAGIVRAIGDPAARFNEDALRLLRAVRFTAELGFTLDPATAAAIPPLAGRLRLISAERIFTELTRMLRGRHPETAFRLLADLGLLEVCLPEIAVMRGVAQPPQYHPEGDVWEHTLKLLGLMEKPTETLAWSALLHDVGKPPTFEFRDGRERFPCHAPVGAEIARGILERFHASRALCDAVADVVGAHMMIGDVTEMRPSKIRRILARPTFAEDLELHRLDCLASHADLANYDRLLAEREKLASEPPIPPPLLTGRDLVALGLQPGPRIGGLLREAQELQLNGELRTPQEALEWARQRLKAEG
jgi:poly(A) polymerase